MKIKILHIILIIILTAGSRLLFQSAEYAHFSSDPAIFVMAVADYSLVDYRPHLPGYYLHIQIAHIITFFGMSPAAALVFLSMLYSVFAAVVFYLYSSNMVGKTSAFLLAMLMVFNPFVWFFSCVSEIYIVELFVSILLIYMGSKVSSLIYTPLMMAVAGGIRPSSLLLLMPLYLYMWITNGREIPFGKIILAHAAGIAAGMAWFLPMISTVGGLDNYLELYKTNNPFRNLGVLQNLSGMAAYGIYLFLPVLTALPAMIFKNNMKKIRVLEKDGVLLKMLSFWFIPPILFFALVHYSKGYYTVIAGAIFVFIMLLIKHKLLGNAFLFITITIEIMVFLLVPCKPQIPEIDFKPETRGLSLTETYLNRLQSDFVPGISAIREKNRLYQSFDSCLRVSSYTLKSYKPVYIFIDPSVHLFIRALQSRYPEKEITYLNKFNEDEYIVFSGLSSYNSPGIKDMLHHSLCCSSEGFFKRYIAGAGFIICENQDFVFFMVKDTEVDELIRTYRKYYLE